MRDVLICALSLAAGLAIAEYYNRGRIDAIRREQIEDLRGQRATCRHSTPGSMEDMQEPLPRSRRSRDLISPEQHAEYVRTGSTRGKRIGGVDV